MNFGWSQCMLDLHNKVNTRALSSEFVYLAIHSGGFPKVVLEFYRKEQMGKKRRILMSS